MSVKNRQRPRNEARLDTEGAGGNLPLHGFKRRLGIMGVGWRIAGNELGGRRCHSRVSSAQQKNIRGERNPLSPNVVVCDDRANPVSLADEGEVVVAAGSVRDGGAAVGGDAQRGAVSHGAAIDLDRAAPGVADADGAASVAAAVDVADCDRAAIGRSGSNAAVTSRSDICTCVLHFLTPSLWPPSEPFHIDSRPPRLETGAPV